ncbi:MAG: V-type ATP synthase subunit A, partial [Treponema sp.]|nr:V-type ATP synthase subunit A [Treponema sp.]
MKGTSGKVAAVNGNMVAVDFDGIVMMNEVAFIETEGKKLKGEVIRIKGSTCSLQVFEMTKGITVGDTVDFSGDMLAVELGPGLLTQIYDGLQNPLPRLAE